MTNEIPVKTGAQFLFADHATDFGAAPTTAANSLIIGTPTDVQIDLTSLGASGGARESAKADLTALRAAQYSVDACLEHAVATADGEVVDFYWGPSPNSTAATGNMGVLTGSDASITDTAGNLGQLQYIGSMTLRANAFNKGHVGTFSPAHRYGSLVVVNQSTQAFAAAMDETHITITEIMDEIQDAP